MYVYLGSHRKKKPHRGVMVSVIASSAEDDRVKPKNYLFEFVWRSVLLVEKTGVPGGNHRPAASH
jgi:hypothetical protein